MECYLGNHHLSRARPAQPQTEPAREAARHTFLKYHDGGELRLGADQTAEHQPTLAYAPAVYDYYAYFRDVSGTYWVIDAKTQQPVSSRRRRQIDAGPSGLHAGRLLASEMPPSGSGSV
jgi:hypothetical protein